MNVRLDPSRFGITCNFPKVTCAHTWLFHSGSRLQGTAARRSKQGRQKLSGLIPVSEVVTGSASSDLSLLSLSVGNADFCLRLILGCYAYVGSFYVAPRSFSTHVCDCFSTEVDRHLQTLEMR